MKILFYDLETTGVLPSKNGIHQISGEICIDGETKETFDFKVRPNPKAEIVPAALQVAGVTEEQILSYPPMEQVFNQFVAMLSKYVDRFDKKDKFFLAGFNNASFDNNFFRGWFLQNGDKYFGSWFWSNTIDLMVMATPYLASRRSEMENFKLSTVAAELGVDVSPENLHDASYDIYLTKEIFKIVSPFK
ncbi:MAG TPA: 3'-5' exonuclease [Porphyromonadaceae bacterium]|nr:3'-5' exonuclease [Porphyromonadaceae bacterium]